MRLDVMMLTLQCVHGAAMLDVCAHVLADPRMTPDQHQLASSVGFDAAELLAHGRECLVDMGASVERAVEALRGER